MNQPVLQRPAEATPTAFCKLATDAAIEAGLSNGREAAQKIGISPTRWYQIRQGELPDFFDMTDKAQSGWITSIARICERLSLDTRDCLTAIGLPIIESAIAKAKNVSGDIELGEKELNALQELLKLTGKPIPLSFATRFLAMKK